MLMMLTLLIGILSGCGEKSDINKTLDTFEAACQTLDVKGALGCVNPSVASPVLTVLDLLGVDDTSGALDCLVSTLSVFGNIGTSTEEFMQSLKIEPEDYAFSEEKDSCEVGAVFQYGTGEEPETMDVVISCVKVDDEWYISGIR
jgi:hypothetical protein